MAKLLAGTRLGEWLYGFTLRIRQEALRRAYRDAGWSEEEIREWVG